MDKTPKPKTTMLRTSLRLSLQYAFLYAILSALVFVLAYWFTQYEVRDWVLDQMEGDGETLTAIYETGGADELISRIDALAEVSFENARVYQLLDDQGDIVAGNITETMLAPIPFTLPATDIDLIGFVHAEVSNYWMREDQIGPYRFVQGSGDHVVSEILEALSIALVMGYLAVVILGILAGVRVGRITEERITAISNTLSNVSRGQLASRVPLSSGASDDLSRVSVEINAMLDKVKRLLESQEQISNDIAHDLRTPLQRLRQRIEGMVGSATVDPDDVVISLRQTEDIIATFNALLRIAQIEGTDRRAKFVQIDLGAIIGAVAEVFGPTAEDKAINIETDLPDGPVGVFGDRNLITQMVSNLVENAIKHCPSGTHITVAAKSTSDGAVLRVADTGQGIEPQDRDRIFRRFFRGEKSRKSAGNGLGLALVKAVADMHGASIIVSENGPGTDFTIRFQSE